jgi:hypothetical protein
MLRLTVGQPVCLGVESTLELWPDITFCLKVALLPLWGALSDERSGLSQLHESWAYKVEVEVKLRPTISQPVRLGVRHPSGTCHQFFFLLEIFFRQLRVCYFVAPSLTRGRVLIYCCCWSSPAQSRPSLSSAGRKTIFYFPNSWDSPNLEGQVPVFISSRNRVAQI